MHSKSKYLRKLPYSVRVKLIEGLRIYGSITAGARLLPNFLIIGAQRCGTSSLYMHLIQHPDVTSALRKEVHFFDLHYQKGINWYRGHFAARILKPGKKPSTTGEASPYYFFHPHTPQRIQQLYPAIKLIVLLRNPVDRAYSHYQHEVRQGFEKLSFEEAIDIEGDRLEGEFEKILVDPGYQSFNHQHFSYLSRGNYADQLLNWFKYFKPVQILTLQSEYFYQSPKENYLRVLDFLGLQARVPAEFRRLNGQTYPPMAAKTREKLSAYFEPFNRQLYGYLGIDQPWW